MPPPQQFDPNGNPIPPNEDELQEHFENFYEDIFDEMIEIGGELEQLRVCENLSDHLSGNVYAKFRDEDDAQRALNNLVVRDCPPHIPLTSPHATSACVTKLHVMRTPRLPPSSRIRAVSVHRHSRRGGVHDRGTAPRRTASAGRAAAGTPSEACWHARLSDCQPRRIANRVASTMAGRSLPSFAR